MYIINNIYSQMDFHPYISKNIFFIFVQVLSFYLKLRLIIIRLRIKYQKFY